MKELYSATKGDRIRIARKAMGLTQMQLAKQVKTTQQTIHDYEKNKRGSYADINLLINISRQCAVTIDWLLTGNEAPGMSYPIPILPSEKALLQWLISKEPYYLKPRKVGFCLKDDAMLSQNTSSDSFKPLDIIILSSDKLPHSSNYVIAITQSKGTPILFRQLLVEKNASLLVPLNNKYPTVIVDSTIQIAAVAIEQHKLL